MTVINKYFLDGTPLTEVIEECRPYVGEEICIDDVYYTVAKSIRYITMIPPWVSHVHLARSNQ